MTLRAVYRLDRMYILIKIHRDKMGYTLTSVQTDKSGVISDRCVIENITVNERVARRIFNLIVKYKAFSCSICEIIEDLLC